MTKITCLRKTKLGKGSGPPCPGLFLVVVVCKSIIMMMYSVLSSYQHHLKAAVPDPLSQWRFCQILLNFMQLPFLSHCISFVCKVISFLLCFCAFLTMFNVIVTFLNCPRAKSPLLLWKADNRY